MSIDELQAAIERRGYTVKFSADTPISTYAEIYIIRGDQGERILISKKTLEDASISVRELVECWLRYFTNGQHHVQHYCGFPLLKETKNAGNHETLAYRAACVGPQSECLVVCPQCEQYVQDESVKEIEDL